MLPVSSYTASPTSSSGECEFHGCVFQYTVLNPPLTSEGYILIRRGRDPSDIFYVTSGSVLVVATGVAFAIFSVYIANEMPFMTAPPGGTTIPSDRSSGLDFGGLGPAAAYAVLILSWLVTLLCKSLNTLVSARELTPMPQLFNHLFSPSSRSCALVASPLNCPRPRLRENRARLLHQTPPAEGQGQAHPKQQCRLGPTPAACDNHCC